MLKAEKRRGGRLRGVGGREDGVEGGEQVAGRTGCWGPLAGAKRRCLSGVVSQVLTRAVPRLYSHHSAPVPAAGGVQAVRLAGRTSICGPCAAALFEALCRAASICGPVWKGVYYGRGIYLWACGVADRDVGFVLRRCGAETWLHPSPRRGRVACCGSECLCTGMG